MTPEKFLRDYQKFCDKVSKTKSFMKSSDGIYYLSENLELQKYLKIVMENYLERHEKMTREFDEDIIKKLKEIRISALSNFLEDYSRNFHNILAD